MVLVKFGSLHSHRISLRQGATTIHREKNYSKGRANRSYEGWVSGIQLKISIVATTVVFLDIFYFCCTWHIWKKKRSLTRRWTGQQLAEVRSETCVIIFGLDIWNICVCLQLGSIPFTSYWWSSRAFKLWADGIGVPNSLWGNHQRLRSVMGMSLIDMINGASTNDAGFKMF